MEQNKKVITITIFILLLGAIFLGIVFFQNDKKTTNQNVVNNQDIKKDAEQQIAKLTEEINGGTKDTEAKRNLARAYYLVGDIESSEKFIKEAMAVNEKAPQYYVDMGLIYQTRGDISAAEEQFKKAVELNTVAYPDPILADFPPEKREELSKRFPPMVYKLPSPYTQLARLYIDQGKNDEAISVLEKGTSVLPTYPDFYLMLSELYRDKDIEKAGIYRKQFEGMLKNETVKKK